MPSRVPPYTDTAGAASTSYSWPVQQGVISQASPSSSPPGAQPTPYYGYAVASSGSYDSHYPPYPTASQRSPPQRAAENENQVNNEKPQQAKEREGSGYEYSNHAKDSNLETPVQHQQDRAGPSSSSPLSKANSYEQQQQQADYPRAPEANTCAGSTEQTSPPKYTGGSPAYSQAVPRSFVSGQHRALPGYVTQYAWTHAPPPPPPYGSNPYSPSPHARRSLAPEYSSQLNRQQGSDAAKDERGTSLLQQAASSNRTKPRASSPTQIESSRRDEVANMGCTCKKSKCLKLYCMCFGASVVCGPNCRCLVCFNTPDHEAERKEAVRVILSRNPAAFDTKFKKNSEKTSEATGSSERVLSHKVGCKCRKSQCTKKYCECFNAGIKCR